MKIRTDFVTNSSSSSFTLEIGFKLVNGKTVSFCAHGGDDEAGVIDYFYSDAVVTVSPKELGTANSVEEMIKLLTDGVVDDDWDEGIKIFEKSNPIENEYEETHDAYDFITEIRSEIKRMDDIETITISGNEENYESYYRSYTYNRKTGQYTGVVEGEEFEKDGSSGGDLRFDTSGCESGKNR